MGARWEVESEAEKDDDGEERKKRIIGRYLEPFWSCVVGR